MSTIDCLHDFSNEINKIIEEQFEKTNKLWKEQQLEEKYKISYTSSNIKLNACYYLSTEWKKINKTGYTEIMDILEACKTDFEERNNSKFPDIFYEDTSELIKYYVYRKTELLIDKYLSYNCQ
tara:strand:+ start:2429 stop:2797 length:369 start_codon:yes stop_codon:yes gene_type:complete